MGFGGGGVDKGDCQVSGLDGGSVKVDGGIINYDKKIRQRRRFWEWRSPIFRYAKYEVLRDKQEKLSL